MHVIIWLTSGIIILIGISFFAMHRLRQKLVSVQQKEISLVDAPRIATATSLEFMDGIELSFGPSAEQPLVSVTSMSACTLSNTARRIEPNQSNLGHLIPLLQAAPNLLVAGEFAQSQYMRVIINGPLAATKDGQYLLPFVRDANGKIVEQAKLMDPTKLSNLVSAAALFQIASVVVAQKHLADISKKLDDIKQGVDRIQAFQNESRKSHVTSSLKYFDQVAQAVLQGELSMPVRQNLEDYEAKLLAVQDHLTAEIQRETKNIETLKDGDMFGSKGLQEVIQGHQLRLTDLNEQWMLCLRARAAGWQLLSAFPGEPYLKTARQNTLQVTLEAFTAQDGSLYEMEWAMNRKIDTIKSLWNKQATLDARKMELRAWSDALVPTFQYSASTVRNQIVEGKAMLLEQQNPVVLALKLEAGKVSEAFQLQS